MNGRLSEASTAKVGPPRLRPLYTPQNAGGFTRAIAQYDKMTRLHN
jgi:hypothetical protein